jgi:hypothetical protein
MKMKVKNILLIVLLCQIPLKGIAKDNIEINQLHQVFLMIFKIKIYNENSLTHSYVYVADNKLGKSGFIDRKSRLLNGEIDTGTQLEVLVSDLLLKLTIVTNACGSASYDGSIVDFNGSLTSTNGCLIDIATEKRPYELS